MKKVYGIDFLYGGVIALIVVSISLFWFVLYSDNKITSDVKNINNRLDSIESVLLRDTIGGRNSDTIVIVIKRDGQYDFIK